MPPPPLPARRPAPSFATRARRARPRCHLAPLWSEQRGREHPSHSKLQPPGFVLRAPEGPWSAGGGRVSLFLISRISLLRWLSPLSAVLEPSGKALTASRPGAQQALGNGAQAPDCAHGLGSGDTAAARPPEADSTKRGSAVGRRELSAKGSHAAGKAREGPQGGRRQVSHRLRSAGAGFSPLFTRSRPRAPPDRRRHPPNRTERLRVQQQGPEPPESPGPGCGLWPSSQEADVTAPWGKGKCHNNVPQRVCPPPTPHGQRCPCAACPSGTGEPDCL